jgi:hypothetical protein
MKTDNPNKDEQFDKLFEYEEELHDMLIDFVKTHGVPSHRLSISLSKQLGAIVAAHKFSEKDSRDMINSICSLIKTSYDKFKDFFPS